MVYFGSMVRQQPPGSGSPEGLVVSPQGPMHRKSLIFEWILDTSVVFVVTPNFGARAVTLNVVAGNGSFLGMCGAPLALPLAFLRVVFPQSSITERDELSNLRFDIALSVGEKDLRKIICHHCTRPSDDFVAKEFHGIQFHKREPLADHIRISDGHSRGSILDLFDLSSFRFEK